MATSLLSPFSRDHSSLTLIEYLNCSSFDELILIDLNEDRYKFIFNVEEKYEVPATEGVYSLFYDHVANRVIHPDDRRAYIDIMNPATVAQRLENAEIPGALYLSYRFRSMNGGWQWIDQYLIGGPAQGMAENTFYCYIFDIQSRKAREAGKTRVTYRSANHGDPLTGLMTEKDFYSACEINLSNTKVNWLLAAIDLQHFKLFNEWYGRDAGNRVLADIGHELSAAAETHDGVAGHMGGDDFALLAPVGKVSVDDLFSRIHGILGQHGASIGFLPAIGAVHSLGSASIYNLYDQALMACQEAKKDYKRRVMYFDPSMVSKAAEDYQIISDFRDAMHNGEITFHLQPQCRSLNGHVVGAEALARWIRPDGRRVPPISFVPVLEKYGFIPDLDKYIWTEVCKWIRGSLDAGAPLVPVSVNISPVDIFTMDVPAFFESLVEKYDLPRAAVKVEITESAYGEDSDKIRSTVQDFRDRGFMVLMDDFGSGFSSLNMLRELNVDMIKLDAYFLRMDPVTEKKGMHILESVVNMAKTMDMPIIVEGVETAAQNEYLMSLGCRYIQGYYFYKPMPVAEFEALIARPEIVDGQGFINKANDEFRIREFLNDTVYSDSMLNHIIGPAAIYAWHGDDVDIVRFNQQFYQAVNAPDLSDRLLRIQRFMPEDDVPALRRQLQRAYDDRLNGSSGALSFYKGDGSVSRFHIHFYFLNEDGKAKRFYGASRDVTEMVNLHSRLELLARFTSRTVVFIVRRDGGCAFEVVANGMGRAMGLSRDQLEAELNSGAFDRRLIPQAEGAMLRIAKACVSRKRTAAEVFRMNGAAGALEFGVDADYVDDQSGDVAGILSLHRVR